MNKKILISLIILILLAVGNLYSKPRIEFLTNPKYQYFPKVLQTQVRFDANNIDTWVQNTGIFDQDIRTNNTPGLMWPKGSGRFAIFTAGLSIGTYIDGQLRLASASYKGEYAPGYVVIEGGVPVPKTTPDFKLYKVTSDDSTSADYLNWGKMVPYGAPYVDRNGNGVYDAGDKPGIKDATQTIFICMTDGYPENHNQSEGFSGGTPPIFSEMRLTGWAYNEDGINDMQFYSFVVINKNNKAWNNTFFGFVVDTDLGDATDDYIGCDTVLNMGYCLNSDNFDGNGNPPAYGQNPPASGMDFFLSPLMPTGNPNDSVVFYDPPGSDNRQVRKGVRELGMTSFVYFTNTGSGGIECERDPTFPIDAYRYLTGVKKDGSSWFAPYGSKQRAKKLFPGNPETGEGWTEFGYNGNANLAVIKNCLGGDTSATFTSPAGDRRFIFNSGDANFTVNPGDTQRVVLAQMVARGTNNKNAVTRLKNVDIAAQSLFRVNFKKSPDIPLPKTNYSVVEKGAGKCNLLLSWDDLAESYSIWDSLVQPVTDTSYWKFEGYEIYQIKDKNQPIPDFYQPETMNDNIKLLKTFDLNDGIGYIVDTISNITGGNTAIPVCPPYLLSVPEGFPNTGINRSFLIDKTAFPDMQGNESQLILGRTYYFAVIAYAYKTNAKSGYRKIKRNSISINTILTVRPEAPLGGTVFPLKNADSVMTNRRDLGVNPVVVNQSLLIDAKYKVVYNDKNGLGLPDTTYNILRSVNGGVSWDTLKKFLKYTSGTTQDSSRIIDGVLINVKKINFAVGSTIYNQGVVKDPGARADSIQSRFKGWDYIRNGVSVDVFRGSKHFTGTYPYQSKSMSLTYPLAGTFNNLKSLLRPDQLRKVRIEFTDLNSGQFAYRYFDTSKTVDNFFVYRDSVKVPFKVFQVDSLTNERRQLNCAVVVSEDLDPTKTGGFIPTPYSVPTDTLGNKLLVYIFNSTYDDCATASYKTKNLFISINIDIMYIWAPSLNPGQTYANGDIFNIYPYTTTRPFFSGTIPLWYEFETMKSLYSTAQGKTDLDKIRIVPNPYYGYNDLETSNISKFVTFRNLPKTCTIKIYTLDGVLIRTLRKDNTDSTYPWDLKNVEKIPIASGLYIVLIDVPGIGQKVMKAAIFMPEERIDVR